MTRKPMLSLVAVAVAALFSGAALAASPSYDTGKASTDKMTATDHMAASHQTSDKPMAKVGVAKMLSAGDRKFVGTANEAGGAEIKMAKLAMDHASSSDVKDFASRMVSDHQQADDKLDKIAADKGVNESDTLSAKDQAEVSKLSKLEGKAFDREYIKSQLAAHKAAVALFKKESKSANDNDLRQFAASTLPTLEDHLQLVEQLSKSSSRASASSDQIAKAGKS